MGVQFISESQKLIISCQSYDTLEHIANQFSEWQISPQEVSLFCVPSNDCWSRDHGPVTVMEGDLPVLMDFHFNAWGEKFLHEKDDQITSTLYEMGAFEGADIRHVDYILEGGAIDSDGNGTLLTTSQCLLNPNRNPDSSKAKIESAFQEWFGTKRVLWLDHGQLAGDDTDSHVDNLARFCDVNTICYSACEDNDNENAVYLTSMANQLRTFQTATGDPYQLVPLPAPKICSTIDGRRLPASYTNFLIINNAVLVPVYDVATDQQALNILGNCFPGRTIKPVNCSALLEQNGSLHCITMHLPAGVIC